MFRKTAAVILLIIIALSSALPTTPTADERLSTNGDEFVVINSNDFDRILRHLAKRDVATLSKDDESREFADKDYDMELAEVNVFRPVFRFRASYAKRGG